MDTMPSLRTALLDVLYEIRDDELPLIVGGGYGIYLKREYVRRSGLRTLFAEWPEPRATNDLDLFLRPELLIDSRRLRPLAAAFARLGYQVVSGAEKFQFTKPGPRGGREGSLKIDLLTGPQSRFLGTGVQVDARRVRPQPSVDLHAHPVDEAPTLEYRLLPIRVAGNTSTQTPFAADVYLPHPLTFVMMKLFAFRDRAGDKNKDFGRYHALDLYTVLALATEPEWEECLAHRKEHQADPIFAEAARLVNRSFSTLTSDGMIRMRESPYCRPGLQLSEFCTAIAKLFPLSARQEGIACPS